MSRRAPLESDETVEQEVTGTAQIQKPQEQLKEKIWLVCRNEDVRDGLRERLKETGELTESVVFRLLRDFQTAELAGG